ncbi:MAG: 2-dehydro-3-deoxy-6-phosphogalactonate aldolase [Alphaproteobacteria bacterium]|jgi:2-dehydro-3-deoxyphosphogalactonate aldolase|nr:2-dehydro-3-deoxy-6-phosphogalactonate aldolase [Alphaproteobacteria bacterium]MDP6515758.1 2-dehydro-3-deoxy-6-phosphogalactonate aldolase [Alphaproteobacteria bacterium]|tara:strand:+ start:48 stop:683 length:636 start_codon:yes stop_codon:yes gene_type:complete
MNAIDLKSALAPLPLVAIVRGIQPQNVEEIFGALADAGFLSVEIPLNSPQPFKSIETARRAFGDDILVGAGTVLSPGDVQQVHDAGGQFVVSPNIDQSVIEATKSLGLSSIPGASTPSEAFTALNAGADMLKLFPAESLPPIVIKAWRAVLPKDLWLLPVGGITPETMAPYLAVGANGFGLGSSLFRPEFSSAKVAKQAQLFVSTYRSLMA